VRAQYPVLGDELFVLKQELLVHQARNLRQQTRPLVVLHPERPSSQIERNKRVLVY
jgi:hypothetical protein